MMKKLLPFLPYLMLILITPLYSALDRAVFVEVFGCGCVPSAQTNMFDIDFNANDLRMVVYSVLTVLSVIWGMVISKRFSDKCFRIGYCIGILIVNAELSRLICRLYMWQ